MQQLQRCLEINLLQLTSITFAFRERVMGPGSTVLRPREWVNAELQEICLANLPHVHVPQDVNASR